jgi:CheY-like chemotaxis protein
LKQLPVKVLIVDDDDDLLFLLKHQLTGLGYKVELCRDGIDCLEKMLLHQPNVVLLDITMNEISGEDLCHQIKSDHRFHNIKVLLMSGNHDIKRIAQTCHADGYIPKPVDLSMITSRIGRG